MRRNRFFTHSAPGSGPGYMSPDDRGDTGPTKLLAARKCSRRLGFLPVHGQAGSRRHAFLGAMAISFVSTPVKLLLPAIPLVALAVATLTSREAPTFEIEDGRTFCIDIAPLPPPPLPPCGDGSCTAPAPA